MSSQSNKDKSFVSKLGNFLFGEGDEKRIDENLTKDALPLMPETPVMPTPDTSSASLEKNDYYFWLCTRARKKEDIPEKLEHIDGESICGAIEQRVREDQFKLLDIPANINRALELIKKDNFDYDEIEKEIIHSPYLTGEFIKLANSALFRGVAPVASLKQALPRLGEKQVSCLLYLGATRMYTDSMKAFEQITEDIVSHSHAVGVIASYLAKKYDADEDDAFLAGLLHDMGKLAILCDICEHTDIFRIHPGITSEEVLDDVLLPMHEYIGGIIAHHWNLEQQFIYAIGYHHDLDFDSDKAEEYRLPAIVNFSDAVARMLGKGRWIEDIDLFSLKSAEILGISNTAEHVEFLNKIPELFDDESQG